MEKKSFVWWIAFILLIIWQLPQFIISTIMLLFLGKKKLVADRHYNFCWECEKMSGGISLGPFSFVSKISSKREENISHEVDGHTVDSKIFGPLYLIIIGLPSLLNAMFDFTECYFSFFTEKMANYHANLYVDEFCLLQFKNKKAVE